MKPTRIALRGDARSWRSPAVARPRKPPDPRSCDSGPTGRGSVGRGGGGGGGGGGRGGVQRVGGGWEGNRGVRADDGGLPLGGVAVNDREEHFVPPIRTVNVARPELGGHAVPAWVEDEEGVIANGLEVAVVGRLLLCPVHRTLGTADIEGHALGR